MLLDRLVEGDDAMDRRGEAPLPGLLQRLPLVEEIEGERGRIAFAGLQRFSAADDEAHAGHAFQAFVGGSGDRIEGDLAGIHRQGAEGAHGIDEQAPARAGDDGGDLGDGVQHAGGGLAMDDGDMGDGGIAGQRLLHRRGIHRPVLRPFEHGMSAAVIVADPRDALAIGAVDQDQQLARGRHEAADHGLDREGPAALHGHADMAPRRRRPAPPASLAGAG